MTSRRRAPGMVLLDRDITGLVNAIEEAVERVEPLASYLPTPVLTLLVESTARRRITPDFPRPTVIFMNLVGLPESVDRASPEEVDGLVRAFSHAFALINAAVESRGGVLKKVTYHPTGSDMVIYFGVLNAHTNDPIRAAETALSIREIIARIPPPTVGGTEIPVTCQIGLSSGAAFAAEIGEPPGRREFNLLGDTVNTAARLMGRAAANQILLTDIVYEGIAEHFQCEALGTMPLKGKVTPVPLFELRRPWEPQA